MRDKPKNIYDLTLAAEVAVSTYRRPDIREWRDAIDMVLDAAGESCIGGDTVEAIDTSGDTLTIDTSYVSRGCPDTSTVSLPLAILKADNPVSAAQRYRLDTEIETAKAALADAQRVVSSRAAALAKLEGELVEFCAAETGYASSQGKEREKNFAKHEG